MIRISIQGMEDGKNQVEESFSAGDVDDIDLVFRGIITIQGVVTKFGNRFTTNLTVSSIATLECDRSLLEYDELISAELRISFVQNSSLIGTSEDRPGEDSRVVRDEDKWIELAEDVRQLLLLSLPMKRISPNFKDKEWSDIYPEYQTRAVELGADWSVLQQLKIDN